MLNHNKLAIKTILGFCILFSANCTVAPVNTQTQSTLNQLAQPFKVKEFVGTVAGTDALIGFAIDGNKAIGYVVGGDSTWQSYTGWFSGTVQNNFFSLTSDDNRVLTGKFSGANVSLSNRIEGKVSLADGTIL